jgi:hypothetical protein
MVSATPAAAIHENHEAHLMVAGLGALGQQQQHVARELLLPVAPSGAARLKKGDLYAMDNPDCH